MKRNKITIGILLLAMLVGMALIPTASAEKEDNYSMTAEEALVESFSLSEDIFFEGEYYLPDYGPSTFEKLQNDSDVIEIRGDVPKLTQDEEKVKWLTKLETCIRSSEDELYPYMKENGGPLIGFGISYDGYLFVDIDEELADTINKSAIDDIYGIIDDGEELQLSDIPVVFTWASTPQETSRTSTWSPLIGGIRIVRSNGVGSTLSFAAKDSSGNKGFVMSGHAAYNAGIGGPIYQPTTSRLVGYVNDYVGHYADAGWVKASNVDNAIYYTDPDITRDVVDSGDANNGSKVYMSGITTGLTYGNIDRKYINVNSPTFGTLYDQYRAAYPAAGGDSGAPVFQLSGSDVKIVGVQWGYSTNISRSYFSPISGVILDLGVTPLET